MGEQVSAGHRVQLSATLVIATVPGESAINRTDVTEALGHARSHPTAVMLGLGRGRPVDQGTNGAAWPLNSQVARAREVSGRTRYTRDRTPVGRGCSHPGGAQLGDVVYGGDGAGGSPVGAVPRVAGASEPSQLERSWFRLDSHRAGPPTRATY